jgi:hypothetical protein
MKKLLTFLFALMLLSNFSYGNGNYFKWTGAFSNNWQDSRNWTAPAPLPYPNAQFPAPLEPGGTSTWPGQSETGDWAVFQQNPAPVQVVNVPDMTLGRLEVTYIVSPLTATSVELFGAYDGVTITMRHPSQDVINEQTYWIVKVDENCILDLTQFLSSNPNSARVKMVCQPRAHFWHKNGAFFFPADYSSNYTVCDMVNKGFVLQASATEHAEMIQQQNTFQTVKGWTEYVFDDGKYHYICMPITSDVLNVPLLYPVPNPEFLAPNEYCRKHNCLCVFDGDYLRKYNNAAQNWDPWLGTVGTCFNPIVDAEIGRGYEYYGNSTNNPSGHYWIYGDYNSEVAGAITLPVTNLGWNLVGNPFASAIKFDEPSGAPTAGVGWFWDSFYNDPIAYWWDNTLNQYRYYNWYIGVGNGANVNERRTVPRSQGFFVYARQLHLNGSTDPITIGNLTRIFRGVEQIGKSVVANSMNVTLNDESGKIIDEAIINFREEANGTEFNHLLDAYKIFNDITNPSQLYFKTTDNVDASMKTLKLETGKVMYPIYMRVVNSGTYSLDVKDISTFSANTGILLKDNKTNATIDLKANPVYTFTATAGDDNARFSFYFSDVLYGVNNLDKISYLVYSYDKSIYIQNNDLNNATGTVVLYDMVGKQILQEKLNSDAVTRINTNLNTGFYIVSVTTGKGVYNQKVYIN